MFEGLGVAALTLLAGMVGYFADRWITGRHGREKTEGTLQALELARRLREEGLSLEQAEELNARVREGRLHLTPEQIAAVVRVEEGDDKHHGQSARIDMDDYVVMNTTVGMRMGLGNRLREIEGKIEIALAELSLHASPARSEAIAKAQKAWKQYAEKESQAVGLLYEGGTAQPVLELSCYVSLAEARLDDLKRQISDEAQL
jgi:DNA-binding transcriptional MerR regulator